MKTKDFSKEINTFCLKVSFDANKKSFSFEDYRSFDCRNISTMKLFATVLSRLRYKLTQSFDLPIITDDFANYEKLCFAYAKYDYQKNIILIPDFFFDGWASIGCKNYDEYMDRIVKQSKMTPEFKQLFWSGSLDIAKERVKFFEISKNDNRIKCIPINWKRNQLVPGLELEKDEKISLVDFNKYKYLIDLPCRGYSGRFKALLFSGRPLFKVQTELKEYFYNDLKPFEHYIPVKKDLSDLIEKLDWAENNYDKALQIAKNAQEYAINNLRTENALNYLENVLYNIPKEL